MSDDWEIRDPTKVSFGVHCLAGITAGISEHVVFFPIDTIRTNMQVAVTSKKVSAQPNNHRGLHHHMHTHVFAPKYENNLEYLKRSVRVRGIRRLWRGMTPTFLACIPAHACFFSIYEGTLHAFGKEHENNPMVSALAGSLATLAHDSIMTPLDCVKQRMQLGLYKHTWHAFKVIIKTDGIRALYASYFTTLLMNIPNSAILVACNDFFKSILNPSGKQNTGAFLLSGFLSGGISAFLTCPLDVIKTRLQTNDWEIKQAAGTESLIKKQQYRGLVGTATRLYREEGVSAFFMGAKARIFQQAPAAALSWTVYETVKRLLIKATNAEY